MGWLYSCGFSCFGWYWLVSQVLLSLLIMTIILSIGLPLLAWYAFINGYYIGRY